jgi:hypothetical protein
MASGPDAVTAPWFKLGGAARRRAGAVFSTASLDNRRRRVEPAQSLTAVNPNHTTKLKTPGQEQLDELRASLLTVVEFCPETACEGEDCPFFAVRSLNAAERKKWFDDLSSDELSYLAVYHHIYLNLKMSQEPVTGHLCAVR